MSSEKLRHARIIVLRITHFPLVLAINLFEVGSDLWRGSHSARSTWKSTMGRPASSASLKRHALKPSNSPRPLAAATLVQASLDGKITDGGQVRMASVGASEPDLRSLVLKLSSQVEELTAIVAAQQHADQPKDGDTDT